MESVRMMILLFSLSLSLHLSMFSNYFRISNVVNFCGACEEHSQVSSVPFYYYVPLQKRIYDGKERIKFWQRSSHFDFLS